jgi:hypothetical protein
MMSRQASLHHNETTNYLTIYSCETGNGFFSKRPDGGIGRHEGLKLTKITMIYHWFQLRNECPVGNNWCRTWLIRGRLHPCKINVNNPELN